MTDPGSLDIEKEIERRVAEQLRLRLEAATASVTPQADAVQVPVEGVSGDNSDCSDSDSSHSEDGELTKVANPSLMPVVGEGNLFCDGDGVVPQVQSHWEKEFDDIAGGGDGTVVGSTEGFTISSFPTQREDGRCVGPVRGSMKGAPEAFADVQLGFYSARQLVVLPEQSDVIAYDPTKAPSERSLSCIEHRFEVEAAEVIEKVQLLMDRDESPDESSDEGTPSTNDDEGEVDTHEQEGSGALQGLLDYTGDSSAPERLVSLVRESIELDDPFVLSHKASKEDMPRLKVTERCPYVYESLMAADGQSTKKSPFQKPVSAVSLFNNGTVIKIDVDEVSGALHQQYGRNCDPLHICFAVYSLSTAATDKKGPSTKLSDDFWMLTDSDGFVQKAGADYNNLKSFVVFIPEEYRRTPLVLLCRVLRSVGGGNSIAPKPAANANVSAVDYSNNYYVTSQNSLDMSNFDNVVDFYQRPHKYHSHFENNTSKGEPCSILKQENQQLSMMVGQIQQELGWCVFEINHCLAGKAPNYAMLNTGTVECYGLYRGCPSNPSPYTASSSLPIQLDTKQVVDFILTQYISSPMKLGKPASATVKAAPEVASVQISTTASSHGLKLIPISVTLKITDVTPFNVVGGSKSSASGIQYDISFPSTGLPEETESLAIVREEPTFTKGSANSKVKETQSKSELCRFCPSPLLILNSGYFNAYHNVYYVRLSSMSLSKFFTFLPSTVKTGQTKKKLPSSHTTFAVQVSLKENDEGDFSDSEGLPCIYGKNLSETFFETSTYSTAMSGCGVLVDTPTVKGGEEPKLYFSQDEIKFQLPSKLTALHHLFFTFYAVDTTTATSAMTAVAKKTPTTDAPSGPLARFIKIGYSVLPLQGDSKANYALFAKDSTTLPLILPENAAALGNNYLSKLAASKSRYESSVSDVDVNKNGEVATQGNVPSVFAFNGAPCVSFSAIPRSTVFATSSNLSATLNSMQTTLPLIVRHFDLETSTPTVAASPLVTSGSYDSIFIDQLRGVGSNLSLPEVLAYYPALSSYHMSIIGCTSNTTGSNGIVSLAVRKIALRTLLKLVQMVHQYDSNTRIQFRRVGHQQSTLMHAGKVVTTTVVNTLYTYFSNDVLFTDGKYLFPIAQGLAEVWMSELEELEKAGPGKSNPLTSMDKDRELHRQRLVDFSWFLLDSILRSVYHTLEVYARKNADSSKTTSDLRQECFPDTFYDLISNLLVAIVKFSAPVARVQIVQRVASFLRQLFVLSMPKRIRERDSTVVSVGVGLNRGRILGAIHAVSGYLCSECGYSLSAVSDLTTLEKGANLPSSSSAASCLQVQSFVRTLLNSADAYLLFTPIPSNYFPALMMRALLPHILHSGSLDVRSGAQRLIDDTIGYLITSASRFGSVEGDDVKNHRLAQSNLRAVLMGSSGTHDGFNANSLYGGILIFMCRYWKEIVASTTPPSQNSKSSSSKRSLLGTPSDRRQAALVAVWTVFTGGMGGLRGFVSSLVQGPTPHASTALPTLFFVSESEPVRKHLLAGLFQMFSDAQSSFRHAHYGAQKQYYSIAVSRQRAVAGVVSGPVMLRRKRAAGESDVQGEDEKLKAMLSAAPYTSPRIAAPAAGKSKKPSSTDSLLVPLFDSSLSTVVSCVGAVVAAVGVSDGCDWLQFGLSGFVSDPSVVSSEGGAPFTYPFFILLEALVSILNNSISLTIGAATLHCAAVKLLPHLISKRATYFPGVLLLLSRLLSFAVCAVDSTSSPQNEGATRTNLVDVFYKSQLRRMGAGMPSNTSRIVMHRGGVSRLIAVRTLAEVVRRYTRLIGGGGASMQQHECIENLGKLQPTLSTAFVTVAESRGRNLKVASTLVEGALSDVVTILQYLERSGSASLLPEGYWAEYCAGYQTATVSEGTKAVTSAVKGSRLLVLDESSGSQEKPVLPLPLSVIRGAEVMQDVMLKVAAKPTGALPEIADDSNPETPTHVRPDGFFDHHVDPLELTPIPEGGDAVPSGTGASTLSALPDGFQEAIPSILGLFRAVLRLQYDEVLQVSTTGSDKKSTGALLQQIHKGVAYWGVISAFLGGKDSEDGAHHHESRRTKLVEMPAVADPKTPYTSVRQISVVHPGKHLGGTGMGSVTCASLQQGLKWLQKLYELHLSMATSTDTSGNSNAEAAVTLLAAASVAFKLVECFYDAVDAQQRQTEASRSTAHPPSISLPSAFLPPAILSHVFWHDFVRILPDLQAAGQEEGSVPLLPVLRAFEAGGVLKTPLHALVDRELQSVWGQSAQNEGDTVNAATNPLLSMLFNGCTPAKSSTFTFTSSLFTTLGQQHAVSTAADLFLAAADGKGKKDENASLYRKTAIQALHLASTIAAARRDNSNASAFHQKLSKLYGMVDRPLGVSDHTRQHRFYLMFARMTVDPVPQSSSLRVLFKVLLRNIYVKRRLKKLLTASNPPISEAEAKETVEAEVEEFAYGLVEEYLGGARRLQSKYLPSPGLLKVFKVPAEIEKSKMEKTVAIPLVVATAPSLVPPPLDPAAAVNEKPVEGSGAAIALANDNLDGSIPFPLDDLATHFYYAYLNHVAASSTNKSRRSKAPTVPDTILNSDNYLGVGGGGPELGTLIEKLHKALVDEEHQGDSHAASALTDCESMTMSMSSMSFTASGAAGSKKRRNKEVIYRLIKDAGRVFQNKMENVCNVTVCEVFPHTAENEDADCASGFIGSFRCQLHVGLDKIHRPSSRASRGNSLALAKASTVVDPQDQRLEDRIVTISRTFPTTTTVGEVVGMQVRETDCMGTALTLVGRETSSVKAALLELQTSLHAAAASPTRAPVMTLLQKLHTSLLSPMSISPPGEYYKQVMHRLVKPGAMPKAPTKAVAEVKASCEEYISEVKKAMDEILTADSLPSLKGPSIMEKAPEVCAQVFKAIADLEVALLSVTS